MKDVRELKDFASAFEYKPDGRLDSWRDVRDTATGDCDDHATTSAIIWEGSTLRMWISTTALGGWRTQFYWCRTERGGAHVIVWIRGVGYVDNIKPHIRQEPIHKRRIWLPLPFILLKMGVGYLVGLFVRIGLVSR